MKKTVQELQNMPVSELIEWYAYYNMEPFGPVRDDLHFALVACVMANSFSKKKFAIEDFILDFREKKEQTQDEMKAILKGITEQWR